jgi:predicted dehydrogenase
VRLGFLGLGWIGLKRLESVVGQVDVAGLADPSAECRDRAAELAPGAALVETLDDLLQLPLDGIVIATPSALHAEQSIRALQAGLAVYCQKPLARSTAEAQAVVDAAQRANRLLGVDLCYRETLAMQALRAELPSLGRLFALDLVFHNAYGPDKSWFYDKAQAGGGCVMDLGIHLVDLALWLTGFPVVENICSNLHVRGSVEDYAVANLQLHGGISARVACSWNLPAGQDAEIGVRVYGENGGAAFFNLDGSFYDFAADRLSRRSREPLFRGSDEWGGRAIQAWAARAGKDPGYCPKASEHVRVAEVLDGIYANQRRC